MIQDNRNGDKRNYYYNIPQIITKNITIPFNFIHSLLKESVFSLFIDNISLFKRYILEDEPLPQNVRFTKELNEIYDAYTSNQLLRHYEGMKQLQKRDYFYR